MRERKGLSRRQLLGASAGARVRAALGLPTARAVARQGASGGVDSHDHIVLMGNRPGYHTPGVCRRRRI